MILSLPFTAAAETGSACPDVKDAKKYSESEPVKLITTAREPKSAKAGFSLRYVRELLEKSGLVKTLGRPDEAAERGGQMDNLKAAINPSEQTASDTGDVRALNARDAGLWLQSNGFVNISACEDWKTVLVNPMKVPTGAVVVYRHPRQGSHPGHIEIATPGGFWSDLPRKKREYSPGLDIAGIFIKPVR